MGIFQNSLMTLQHSNGTEVAQHLPCQVDTVNLPWNIEAQGMIPTDWFDVFSIGWTSPVPQRSDYLIDEATGAKYSVFSTVFAGVNTLQFRVSKPSGATP